MRLPEGRNIFGRVPASWPKELLDHLISRLPAGCQPGLVELLKGGFGLPESPRLWYFAYRQAMLDLGFKECRLLPALFMLFHKEGPRRGQLRALSGIHVDDSRMTGDETAESIWGELRKRFDFKEWRLVGPERTIFCGRSEHRRADGA